MPAKVHIGCQEIAKTEPKKMFIELFSAAVNFKTEHESKGKILMFSLWSKFNLFLVPVAKTTSRK